MKGKKGIIFATLGLIYMVLIVIILILLVWFGFKISAGLSALFSFLKTWWWAILLGGGLLLFNKQVKAILNTILGRVGVKV